jgi:poly(3-hydroxybutyrate) depolymerase
MIRSSKRRAVARLVAPLLASSALLAGCGERGPGKDARGERLAPLSIAGDSVTVSGLSAGGYMAVQFHVAHSALVNGAGIIAAGPYFCAENSLRYALGRCMKGDEPIAADELASLTRELALNEAIDPIAGLATDRVWIFHGGADPVVSKPVVDALQSYYELLVDPRGVRRVELAGAGHTFPAAAADLQACSATDTPFIGNCGVDGARQMLEFLYGPFGSKGKAAQPGTLAQFSQAPYAKTAGAEGLAARGWLYVPAACSTAEPVGRCRLHVAFHGCKQGASYVHDAFVKHAGYLAAADAGNVVVLFPQVEPSYQPLNPNGCWDWWGYGSEDYPTRSGPQIVAIKAMVDDLLGGSAAARPRQPGSEG